MGNNTPPDSKDAAAADRPAFEPPRRSRPARTAILAYVAIILTLYACFRVYFLFDDGTPPAEQDMLDNRIQQTKDKHLKSDDAL